MMKTAAERSPTFFPLLLRGLETVLGELYADFSPEAGFANYILEKIAPASVWDTADGPTSPRSRWTALRRHDYAPDLAAAGFFLSVGKLPDTAAAQWRSGFSRLAKRDAFPPDRCSFVYRPEELLGICLGAKHCLSPAVADRRWLDAVVKEHGRRLSPGQPWESLCFLLAADCLGVQGDWSRASLHALHKWATEELALALVAAQTGKGGVILENFTPQELPRLHELMLEKFFSYDPTTLHDGGKQAAIYGAVKLSYQEVTKQLTNMSLNPARPPGSKVFIGHGRSPLWMELEKFLTKRLNLTCDEFNNEPTAGMTTPERLEAMLDDAAFAFLVFTAEDEHHDHTKHARENVVHEQGLFQGRLGRRRAIILLEEGCSEFSNIVGVSQIRFPKGDIRARFEDVRGVLEREGIVQP